MEEVKYLLEMSSVLKEWSSRMVRFPSSEVLCSPRGIGVRLDRSYKLPMKEGDLNFIMASEEITIPVRYAYLSHVDHIMDLEETIWARGFEESLTLEETYTWKELMEAPVEDLMNIVLEQGFRGYLGTKVLERRLSIC
jgi:hypothetical protein